MTPPRVGFGTPPLSLQCSLCTNPEVESPRLLVAGPLSYRPGDASLGSLLSPVGEAFRLPSLFAPSWTNLFPTTPSLLGSPPVEILPAVAPQHLSFADFLPALVALANGIQSMDLDFYQVPVNRGSNLCRFSEYTPRDERPTECSLEVRSGTTARIHGEIRPIRGMDESLITRAAVDFSPNVLNAAPLNPLEIDGFAAVDAPAMSFDRRFLTRMPVTGMSGGDLGYENPLGSEGAFATPFDAEAAVPPHRDWMIRFAPVETSVLSAVQRVFGEARLMLWAFLPTLGLVDTSTYDTLGIRYNTLPRRFGDVIRLFSPLFDRARAQALRQAAPYLNPNTEFRLDPEELRRMNLERGQAGLPPLEGLRQAIPTDPIEVQQINARRETLNAERQRHGLSPLPLVSRNRGPVLDWIFTDLAHDSARLLALAATALPSAEVHARLRDTTLPLPFGELRLRAGTELRVRYFLEPVANPGPGESPVRLAVNLTVEPLELEQLSLEQGGGSLRANSLSVRQAVIELRFPVMTDSAAQAPAPALHFRLEDIHASGLEFRAGEVGLHVVMPNVTIGSVEFTRTNGQNWTAELRGLSGDNIRVEHPALDITLGHASIPQLSLERSYREDGQPGPLSIRSPQLDIDGIHTEGRIPLRDGSFHLQDGAVELRSGTMTFEGDLNLHASLPNGFGEGPTVLGNFTISPSIEDLAVRGRAHFELRQDGWSLQRSGSADDPLSIGFRIADSWLRHRPGELPAYLQGIPAAATIQTEVQIRQAQVQLEDFQVVEYRQIEAADGRHGQIRELRSGPITIHHILGGGSLWVGLPIWGFVRGFFPDLGGRSPRTERRPDMSPLLQHLTPAVRELLGNDDFIRIGGVDLHRGTEGDWRTEIDDLILNLHEAGGRGQFGGIRIPQLILEGRLSTDGPPRTLFELDPNYWANIYLHDPERGGSFRFVRWPRR